MHEFRSLPSKIGHINFKILSKKEFQNYVLFELYINKYIGSLYEIENLHGDLIYFFENSLKVETDEEPNLKFLYENNRRQFRVDIKKFFRNLNHNMEVLFDHVIYTEKDFTRFKELTVGLIQHIEKFYL
jgi:hypothetical protein